MKAALSRISALQALGREYCSLGYEPSETGPRASGHATIATTADIYTHLLDEAKAGAAKELFASEFIQ